MRSEPQLSLPSAISTQPIDAWRRQTARRATGTLVRIIGIADPAPERPAMPMANSSMLMLADDDHGPGAGVATNFRITQRLVADERKRSNSDRHVVGVEIVLHCDRHAVQRPARRAGVRRTIERLGFRHRGGV